MNVVDGLAFLGLGTRGVLSVMLCAPALKPASTFGGDV